MRIPFLKNKRFTKDKPGTTRPNKVIVFSTRELEQKKTITKRYKFHTTFEIPELLNSIMKHLIVSCNGSVGFKIQFTKLFINGQFVDSVSGKTFETRDPSNGEVIASVAEGDKADVDLAVKAARNAFDNGAWPRMSGYERGRIMMKFADLIEEHAEELATIDAIDGGKLFSLCKAMDIPHCVHLLRYYAGAADKIHGETLKLSGEFQGYTLKEPIGVIGHIIPWNFPTAMFFLKVSPALAAGCTMIVKPAEQTPLSALYYAHLAKLVIFCNFFFRITVQLKF
ncbi:aldehyde dehydrogenase family 2 member C4-like [Dendrobium catenatum]|uniref:aldehyde dehydrogenase family 2 member C4-like n=1 Tax=Dendrobium catenatum TaxID=906689 RepID=UPI00109F36AA|nr:aldehyde dehydrogenase family 2 member C4-like [Dendrobium catenatum]